MTMYERLDCYNNNRMIGFYTIPDGKIQVEKTHGTTLKTAIDIYCNSTGISVAQYYQTLEMKINGGE